MDNLEAHSANVREGDVPAALTWGNRSDARLDETGEDAESEITLPAVIESIPKAIDFITRTVVEMACLPEVQKKLAVIADEIVGNIAKFAYGSSTGDVTIRVSADRDRNDIQISFIDGGIAFNPLAAPEVDVKSSVENRRIGGQGILIVKRIADEMAYEREDGKNVLRVRLDVER